MKSCLICDDHALVREALAGTVRLGWPDAAVAEAGDFPAAWAEASRGHDTCIADLMMPGASPREGIARLQRTAPGMAILIVTGTEDDALLLLDLLDLLDLGVAGFAPKTSNGRLIEAALRVIVAGGRYLPPRVVDIAACRTQAIPAAVAPMRPETGLSERQLAVLRLALAGLSTKEIARGLGLAPSTVKTHLSHIQIVLGAKNRMEVARRARELGLPGPEAG